MAAYGALVSLMHIIDQIQHHPRPPISLDKEQVESLTEMICFLQDFLEAYDSHGGSEEAGGLQSRIADAAYAIEDIIESHIVDQILAQSSCSVDFYQRLQKVIQDMDFTKKEAMEIRDKMGVQNHPHKSFTPPVSSRSSTGQNNMVGFDDVLYEIMDKLTGSQQSSQRIIPIVGMGGIGKTTLARNVYVNELIVQHFDIRGWVTISQEYNMREVLLEVLHQKNQGSKESLSQMSEEELGEKLYKSLFGRRYLVIMDDMWSVEVWNKIKLYFPSINNGSWIIITTRLSNLALDLVGTDVVQMSFLDEDKSWNLLCTTVFGGEDCPFELEQVGRKIAKNCKGLPLSIVVIGGLLAKSNWVLEYWKHVAENLNSIVKLEENETCLKILHTSYNLLPIHLKPCFLYMGIFPEDAEIRVSKVIKLWVAEGFLKPISGKNLEVVAKEYLKDLIDRNLILVRKWGLSSGNIKSCNIHDLLRELCLREVEKDKFFCTKSQGNLTFPKDINAQRRIAIYERTLINDEENFTKVHQASQFTSLSRSLICHFSEASTSLDFRLLRVMKVVGDDRPKEEYNLDDIFKLVNLRHIAITTMWSLVSNKISSLSSWCLLWSLQTLIVKGRFDHRHIAAPPEIWEMTQLRHVHFEGLYLPHPPSSNMVKQNEFVLGNLQTLSKIINFNCGEDVVKRIPNVIKLKISYENREKGFEVAQHYCLNKLGRLHKLESLTCEFYLFNPPSRSDVLQNLAFPLSLKKLSLSHSKLHWEDMGSKIGSLPLLQVLKLGHDSCVGPKWETVEGQFQNLKYLLITCYDLEYWVSESTDFPRLEHLTLRYFIS